MTDCRDSDGSPGGRDSLSTKGPGWRPGGRHVHDGTGIANLVQAVHLESMLRTLACLPLIVGTAWAAAPDKVAAEFPAGAGDVHGLQLDKAFEILTAVDNNEVIVVDTTSWESDLTDLDQQLSVACTPSSALAVQRDAGGIYILIGCEQGIITTFRWNNNRVRGHGGDDPEDVLVLDLGNDEAVVYLGAGPDNAVYALQQQGNSNATPLRITVDDDGVLAVDEAYAPQGTFHQGFLEAVPVRDASDAISQVVVAHGGNKFSVWTLAVGASTVLPNQVAAQAVSPVDLTPGASSGAYFIESDGDLFQFTGISTASFGIIATGLGSTNALTITWRDTVTRYLVQAGQRMDVYEDPTASPVATFDLGFQVADMIEGTSGYVFAGTSDASIAVLTANPWVDSLSLSPAQGVKGTEVTLSFTVDEPGSWKAYLDGDRTGSDTILAEGTVDAAGAVSSSFVISTDISEGAHEVWVIHTASGAEALKGYARTDLTVDNPPQRLQLTEANVGFGDHYLYLDFYKLSAADITGYDVYVSATPFSASDYPTGGPEGEVWKVTSPVNVSQPESESRVVVAIGRLKNYTPYYLAVRAIDGSGEGPMSNVVSDTPRPTQTAAELAGEPGGFSCATGGPGGFLGWGLLALAGLGVRRSRAGALAALVAAGTLGSSVAQAQDGGSSVFRRDETPAWANFEIQYASFQFDDGSYQQVYGNSAGNLRVQAGLQLFRYAELDLGVGYLYSTGNTVDASGTSSREEVFLEWLPVDLSASLRLHIIDEQPIVPYGQIGMDYVFWRENPLDADGRFTGAEVGGGKFGWHWGVGGNILLDMFSPRRASMLEATTGINDTWLVIEYRQQYIGAGGSGLDLSGWSISGGLKLDY